MSDVSSVDEHHRRCLPSAPVTMASALTTTMPTTPTKSGTALLSRTGSVKKWDVRRQRGTSLAPSEAIGMLTLLFFFFFFCIYFKPFSNLPFPLAAESQSYDNPDRTPRPETSISSFTREPSSSLSYLSLAEWYFLRSKPSAHAYALVFFELLVALAALGLFPARPGSSGRDSVGHKRRRSMSKSWIPREGWGLRYGRYPSWCADGLLQDGPPAAIGNGGSGGDWNASRTSLKLVDR
jgi:hypothetical protein